MARKLRFPELLALTALWAGCPRDDGVQDGQDGSNSPPPVQGEWYRPNMNTTWQWQLQPDATGRINTSYAADVYDVDLFEAPPTLIEELHALNRRVICYFSAGTFENFRPDAGGFEPAELGRRLADFADERWLDIRSDNVYRIMLARLDLAVQKHCDCVEPDNVDGYANDNGFGFTAADQLEFNRFIANAAHARGLCVGLKNDLDQVPQLVAYFDFSVNEQCHEFGECDGLLPFIAAGKPVFNAEYAGRYVADPVQRAALCAAAQGLGLRTLVLPLALDDAFRFSCEP
ncbi:MAG: endo alpha-1,4 polygalactosaminidase [Planctomycetota bacterium]